MVNKVRIIWSLKLSLGILLLGCLLIWQDNWEKLQVLFGNIRWEFLPVFAAASLSMIWISCLKWNLFLRERGICVSLPRLIEFYVIGIFFNNFFPGNIGGDVARGYLLGRQINSQPQAMVSIFLERFTGLIALVSLCIGVLILRPGLLREPIVVTAVILMTTLCIGFLLMIYKPCLGQFFLSPFQQWEIARKFLILLDKFRNEVMYFQGRVRLFCVAIFYSLLFHFSTGIFIFVSALLIGLSLEFLETIALTPIILLVGSIPLTPNNFGILEWAFSIFLVPAGALPVQGLAVALVLRAKNLIVSLLGGILFLAGKIPEQSYSNHFQNISQKN